LRSEISSKEPDARSASPVLREGWLGNQPSLLDDSGVGAAEQEEPCKSKFSEWEPVIRLLRFTPALPKGMTPRHNR
jgi:hypothetical protein